MPQTDDFGAERSEHRVYRFADLELDSAVGRLSRGGTPLPLPRLSWRLLLALVDAAPLVLSQDELLERVWRGRVVCGETVTQRVKLLRAALGDDASSPRYIGLVRGRGYRLLPEVELETRASPQASQGRRQRRTPPLPRRSLTWGGLLLAVALGAGITLDRVAVPGVGAGMPEPGTDASAFPTSIARAEEAFQKGRHYYNRRQPGDFARAREALQTAVNLDPGHADAWVALAASHYIGFYQTGGPGERKAQEAALAALREALALDPVHARAHARMGQLLRAFGEPVAASRHLRLAWEHGRDDALVLSMAAGDHLDRGAFPEAARTLLRASQLEPLTRTYRVNLVITYVAAGQLDAAEAEIAEFVQLFPESALYLEWEDALIKVLRGRYAEALTAAGHLTRAEERLALTAMAGSGTGAPGLTRRALDELTAMDSLPALLLRIQAQAFLGDEASVQQSLDELVLRCASGQLPREIQRWAWSELTLFPLAPELLRGPASQRLQSNRTVAMVDS